MTHLEEHDIIMKNGYLLVEDLPNKERRTASGIIIPAKKYQRMAKVIASECAEFPVGCVIVKPVGKGTPITIDEHKCEAIKSDYVFAVCEEQ